MKKEKIAIINIPDANQQEMNELVTQLRLLAEKRDINIPYELVFISGTRFETISKKDLSKLVEKLKKESE